MPRRGGAPDRRLATTRLCGLVTIVLVAASPIGASETMNRYTPIVLSVLEAPHPALGSDGRHHLVYELVLLNPSGLPWTVESVEILAGDDRVLGEYAAEAVVERLERLGDRSATNRVEPGGGGVLFVHVEIDEEADVPAELRHRLTLSTPGGFPAGFARFAGLPADARLLGEVGGATPVAATRPVVLAPPLAGSGWVAADGCCEAHRHVRAVLAVDGGLFVAQRFAIDWEKADADRRLFVGDPEAPESYFAYGEPALAVADATVVAAVDGLPDQIPGALPPGLPIAEGDGNHVVLDLGEGRYALYAHLVPGSVAVATGERVAPGQLIGRVGNSGNSSAPHLHFHVMDSPAPLGSQGLPYALTEFSSTGRVASTEAFDRAEAEGTPLELATDHEARAHTLHLPLDQTVVTFAPAADQ